jgi:serine/threonine protein kinase
MSLAAGTRIGVYEIRESLGAGGMGEVYRARDTRLNRDVALKVLPESLAGDPDRLARLHREAQVLASLNHPNIAVVHGFEGDAENGPAAAFAPGASAPKKAGHDIHALVMELVEGPTLADRLIAGPLDLDQAIPIARQIADALDAAHEQGVIHRDLKPANIKIRPDGTVKVLDFGLAKMQDGPAKAGHYDVSQSPTVMSPAMLTGAGVIFGTAAYMSPEQARGKNVDKRSDIWAFGCVLYEMLTGQRPFGGSEVSDTLASVLKDTADMSRVPAPARPLIERCLEKDPRQRLRDIGDAMALLVHSRAQPVVAAARSHRSLWIASAMALVSLIAVVPLAFVHFSEDTSLPRVVRFQFPPPEKGAFGPAFALSPNGRMLAFIATIEAPQLWVHSFDTGESRPLAAAGNFSNAMFWSQDSRFIAFPMDGKLRRISATGDQLQTICTLPSAGGFGGGTWGADDTIVFGGNSYPLMKVPASGGTPQPVTKLVATDIGHVGPQFLPDGKHFFYHRISIRPEERGIYAGSLDAAPESQSATRLLESESRPVVASGTSPWNRYVLFVRDHALLAQAFDPDSLKTVGDPVSVADRAGLELSTAPTVSVADDGTLAYRGDVGATGSPTWVNRAGMEVGAVAVNLRSPQYPRLSPDGTHLALVVDSELWEYDLHGRPPVKLSTEGGIYSPLWTPDGKRLIYESNYAGSLRVIPAAPGTSSSPASPAGHFHPYGWSPDGKEMIVVHYTGGDTGTDIVQMVPETAGQLHAVVRTPAREGVEGFALSPDGRWLAYASNATGEIEVWVEPYGRAGAAVRISPRGGVEPVWAKNGRELYYLEGGRLMVVAIEPGAEFNFKPATPLFDFRYPRSNQPPSYDVAADGRFLVIKPVTTAPAVITVISNWAQNLSTR